MFPCLGTPEPADGARLWELARDSTLDLNSSYAYLIWCRDFADTSVVARAGAEADGRAIGFVTGYRRPVEPDTLFVWQLTVDPAYRGQGLAGRMLAALVDRLVPAGVRRLEATITATNTASDRTFRAFARDRGATLEVSELFGAEEFPDDKPAEYLYRIGPLAT